LGLTAGTVPPRVEAPVKAGLLALVDHAVGAGWSTRRACQLLGLDPDRAVGWRGRAAAGRLADLPCGGGAVHGLLEAERSAIVDLFDAWAGIDRSHRKLAARGSRLELVHASASTVQRVLTAEGLVLQGPAPREPAIRAPWPDWIEWKPGRVWCYDFTHFTRARRVAVAVMDVVSRRWLSTLVSAEETSSQIEAAFLAALDEQQLAERIDARLLARLRSGEATAVELDGPEADGVPVMIAMSDNGPQMRSHSTKEFMAACAIMQRFGRPGTPTDRPGSSRCSGMSKATGRTWRRSVTPANLPPNSTASGSSTTPSGCTPASATSPPTTNTTAAETPSARPAVTDSPRHDRHASHTVEAKQGTHHERAPNLAGYLFARRPD
jgi:putative transposase